MRGWRRTEQVRGCRHVYCPTCLTERIITGLPEISICEGKEGGVACKQQLVAYFVREEGGSKGARGGGAQVEREVFLGQGRKTNPASWISPPELRKALAIHREKDSKYSVVAAWPNKDEAPYVGLLRPDTAPDNEAIKTLVAAFLLVHFAVVTEEGKRLYAFKRNNVPMEPASLWLHARADTSLTTRLLRAFSTGREATPSLESTTDAGQWELRRQFVVPWLLAQMVWGVLPSSAFLAGPFKVFVAGFIWSASKVGLGKVFRALGLSSKVETWQHAWGGTEHVVESPGRRSIPTFSFDNVGMKVRWTCDQWIQRTATSISEKRARELELFRSEMWKEPSLEEFCVAAQEDPDFSLGPSPAAYELLGQITRASSCVAGR